MTVDKLQGLQIILEYLVIPLAYFVFTSTKKNILLENEIKNIKDDMTQIKEDYKTDIKEIKKILTDTNKTLTTLTVELHKKNNCLDCKT